MTKYKILTFKYKLKILILKIISSITIWSINHVIKVKIISLFIILKYAVNVKLKFQKIYNQKDKLVNKNKKNKN